MVPSKSVSHELGLLRVVVPNIELKPHKFGPMTADDLRAFGLARAILAPTGIIGLRHAGAIAFDELAKVMFSKNLATERGSSYEEYQKALFRHVLDNFFGRSAESIGAAEVNLLESKIWDWVSGRTATRRIFVVCVISPWHSPEFNIGPVKFTHVEDIVKRNTSLTDLVDFSGPLTKPLLETMAQQRAHWLATIEINGCDSGRASELGNLSIDLAIVALYLAAPFMGTKNMSRLDARRGTGHINTLQATNGELFGGWSNVEPGLSIGNGYLAEEIIAKTTPLISSIGNIITSFASGQYRLPLLEQAWCDAAYWLHQGLAESLDTIAIAKLETAIEVLLRAEKTSGSERRIIVALEAFFGLGEDDLLTPSSDMTVKQFSKALVTDRSRILHGTWSTLTTRMSTNRDLLELVAASIIRSYAVEIESYFSSGGKDLLEDYLTWVKQDRKKRSGP